MALSRRMALAAPGLAVAMTAIAAFAVISGAVGSASADTGAGGCQATARIDSHWGSGSTAGEVVTVTVANTAATTATTWSVTWAMADGQRIVSSWNAVVSTSGHAATAVNAAWNGRLAPGASTTFGLQLAGTDTAPVLSCGNDATRPTSSPASSSTPPGSGDVNVTEADTQTTVDLVVGQTLGVSLPANYRPFTSTNAAVTLLSTSGGYPTGQPLKELFKAVGNGSLVLSTQTDDPCQHATPPCGMPVHQWTIHVNVAYASPGGDINLTEADNQTTVTMAAGQTLHVSLPVNYRPFTLTNPALILKSSTGGYPTAQPLSALFQAVGAGSLDLSTLYDTPCNHDPTPCPGPYRPWTVHVTILYPPPTPSPAR
jgi:Cellulose binding domain